MDHGITPRSPLVGEPSFDIAWEFGGMYFIGEVKSLTNDNKEQQLRMALGQVLRYRHHLSINGRKVIGCVICERDPQDETWLRTCEAVGVRLAWPNEFHRLLTPHESL
jgi:hypothetical protein